MKKSVFFKRKEILRELFRLEREMEKLNQELDKLEDKCNHEITVKLPREKAPDRISLSAFPSVTRCLLCGEHLYPRKYLPPELTKKMESSVCINIEDYPKMTSKSRAKIMHILDKMYEQFKNESPNLSEKEIGEIIKKELERNMS